MGGEKQQIQLLLAWGSAPIENFEHWNWFATYQREAALTREQHEEQKGPCHSNDPAGKGGGQEIMMMVWEEWTKKKEEETKTDDRRRKQVNIK